MADKEVVTIKKEADFAQLRSDGLILIKGVRFCYPHVFTAYKGDDDDDDTKPRFGLVALMPKTALYFPSKNIIRDEINRLIKEAKLKNIPAERKFLRDGDESGKDEYEGHFTISAGETKRPMVRASKKDPKTGKAMKLIPGKDDDEIYGGCWGNILIRPWFMNNKYGKRVNAGLVAVQKTRDDEAFGQGRVTEDEVDEAFSDFDEDDSGFDDSLDDDEEL